MLLEGLCFSCSFSETKVKICACLVSHKVKYHFTFLGLGGTSSHLAMLGRVCVAGVGCGALPLVFQGLSASEGLGCKSREGSAWSMVLPHQGRAQAVPSSMQNHMKYLKPAILPVSHLQGWEHPDLDKGNGDSDTWAELDLLYDPF